MDDDQGFYSNLSLDDDDPQKVLAGILSPASAQVVEGAPPVAPAASGPGQSTPRTGNLAVAPQQAQPRVSGPAMLPGIATKPENLQPANTGVSPQTPLLRVSSAGNDLRSGSTPIAIRDSSGNPVRSYSELTSPATSAPTAIVSSQPQGTPSQQRWQRIVSNPGGGLAATFAAQQQAYAARPQLGPAPAMPTSLASIPGYRQASMPSLPATASTVAPAGQQKLAQDQAALTRYQQTGSGIDQIKNPVGRGFARAGDIALSILAPNVERIAPGTTGNNQRLQEIKQGQIANDQQQLREAAQLADTQGQTQYRQQQAAKDQAQAQADTARQPTPQEATDYGLDPNAFYRPSDIGRAAVQAGKNTATLETHTGGQSHKVSADDAKLVCAPALEGETISNDAWQRMISGVQRNAQSGSNNAATNQNRVTTTSMRDATSTGNSERAHAGKGTGTPKPIPAGVRDRIQSQKDTALGKARADLDSGASTMDDYLNAWQAAQNDYEDRLSAQTGQAVPHTDIRSNVDAKGNWTGGNQPATAQPQAQQATKRPDFITRKGSSVSVGDPVNVNGKKGTVTGFNPTTGKAQVKWEGQ
jgi:hypothetical protein